MEVENVNFVDGLLLCAGRCGVVWMRQVFLHGAFRDGVRYGKGYLQDQAVDQNGELAFTLAS